MRSGPGVAALLGLSVLAAGCGRKEESRTRPPRPVVTADVERVSERQVGPFAGKVEARFSTELGFRIAGRVVTRDALVGQSVRKDATLAELDPTQQKLHLASATADVADGEAQVRNAGAEYNRQAQLLGQGDVPQAKMDLARSNRNTADARLAALRATRQKAEEDLGYTVLKAEFDGVVMKWQTEVGDQVQPGQAVVEMVRPEVREAVVDIPVAIVRALPKDPVFAVTLEGYASPPVEARIREAGALADSQTRTQRLRLSLSSPPDRLRLGSIVSVTSREVVAPRLRLPAAAVFEQDGKSFVWIVEDGKSVTQRQIEVEARDGGSVTAEGDLPPGAPVVVAGVHSLHPGQPVRSGKGS